MISPLAIAARIAAASKVSERARAMLKARPNCNKPSNTDAPQAGHLGQNSIARWRRWPFEDRAMAAMRKYRSFLCALATAQLDPLLTFPISIGTAENAQKAVVGDVGGIRQNPGHPIARMQFADRCVSGRSCRQVSPRHAPPPRAPRRSTT